MHPNFEIHAGNLVSDALLEKGITDFNNAATYISHLPYSRNKDKTNILCPLEEGVGTCGTKHALLKQLAIENQQEGFDLIIGLFRMNGQNTPKVKNTLSKYNLDYIPEAHNYLKYGDELIDCTTAANDIQFVGDLLEETSISPEQITDYKVAYQRNFLAGWLEKQTSIPYSLDEIWTIREECIHALSQP